MEQLIWYGITYLIINLKNISVKILFFSNLFKWMKNSVRWFSQAENHILNTIASLQCSHYWTRYRSLFILKKKSLTKTRTIKVFSSRNEITCIYTFIYIHLRMNTTQSWQWRKCISENIEVFLFNNTNSSVCVISKGGSLGEVSSTKLILRVLPFFRCNYLPHRQMRPLKNAHRIQTRSQVPSYRWL